MGEIHDREAERALLGAVLASNGELNRLASRVLSGSVFAAGAHGKIWDAMLALRERGQVVDHLVLANELKTRGQLKEIGGPEYLMELDQVAPIAANADHYASIVLDRARRRRMVEIGRALIQAAENLESKPEDALIQTSADVAKASAGAFRIRTLEEVNTEVWKHLGKIQEGEIEPVVKTGLTEYDRLVGGMQPTLNIVGGRTAGGKSGYGAAVTQNVASGGRVVGVFSLEDAADWMTYRYLSASTGVPNFKIRYEKKSDHEWEKIGEASAQLAGFSGRVLIDDSPTLSSKEICARGADMILNHGAAVILIDHLGEVNHDVHKRERHELNVRQSLSDFRNLANRYQVPVLLLAQVKEDDGKSKTSPPPTIADFQDAPAAIAKIGRVVSILRLDTEAMEAACHVLKHTNGKPAGVARLAFIHGAGMLGNIKGLTEQLPLHSTMGASSAPVEPPRILQPYRNGFSIVPEEKDDPLPE